MKSDKGIKIRIEHNVPLNRTAKGIEKYPRIKEAAGQITDGDSILFESYYHAAALAKYLKNLGFKITPIRTVRDEKGDRLGWRVWAFKKEDAK